MRKKEEGLSLSKGRYLAIAYLTAFSGGFCVMVVEVIASRLIARYLGASLYTWTSVIGVVLTGISLGNYIGGRIADRYQPQKALSGLFFLASFSCVMSPGLNQLMGKWLLMIYLSWPLRVAGHVAVVFLLPAVALGMISPVVAKMALDQGFKTGRTIGNIYAWGSLGSIMGTFITGFFLIAYLGTTGVVWTVSGILAGIGLCYGIKKPGAYLWPAVFMFLLFTGLSSRGWAVSAGELLALRQAAANLNIIYEAESNYSYIKVEQSEHRPGVRMLILDQLLHSIIRMDEPGSIENLYSYQEVYEGVTSHLAKDKESISALVIGGGGYVFPRYLEERYPGSYIEVVEIDPAVTKAAKEAFGLSEKTTIKISHGDGRNRVNELIRSKEQGGQMPVFDFIYGDAFNDLSIPFQLVSYEFNQQLRYLLSEDGAYMLTLADTMESGRFLGAMLNTLRKSFPYVEVFLTGETRVREDSRSVFVLVGSFRPLDWPDEPDSGFGSLRLDEARLRLLKERSRDVVLSDNYAPVENLLAPVVRERGLRLASADRVNRGNVLVKEGRFDEAIKYFRRVLRFDPSFAEAANNLGNALASRGDMDEAMRYYEECLRIDPGFARAHNNLAIILIHKGRFEEAIGHYQESLRSEPQTAETHYNLGVTLAAMGRLDEAAKCYTEALRLKPELAEAHSSLGNLLLSQGSILEAAEHYHKALSIKPDMVQAHNNLAAILKQQGRLKEAIWHYNHLLRINPAYEQARSNLAAVTEMIRDAKEGAKDESR
ncbi:MAG: fused MFS/spermidine synthase [Candidatus Omnitrophica bacterium]|nr:fused MFS/spermidine synthase [Candidatus Omnitrophota bacterium]